MQSTRNAFIALGVVAIGVIAVIALAAGNTGGGSGGGGDQGSDREAGAVEAAGGTGETFTEENYPELVSDPEAHEGAEVDITGQIFTAPEPVEGDTGFQTFADPENGEWNTAVLAEGSDTDLGVDDYVRVVGTVAGANDADQASVPQYAAKKDEEGINNGQTVAIFTVTTGADSEEDLRTIVEDLRAKNPDPDGLAVFFKPQGGAFVGSGFAFDNAETEEAFLKSGDIDPAEWEAGKEDGTSILLE